MEDIKELKDEKLEEVSGGASGKIPQGGIEYKSYSNVNERWYYADQNKSNYAYVYRLFSYSCSYRIETLNIDESNGTWTTVDIGSGHDLFEEFKIKYPYRLNIRSNDEDSD